MQLQNRIAYLSIFTAATISLFIIESFIPQPVPGIRLGLANIFILLVLLNYEFKEAMIVGILKSIVGSLIIGRLLSPSFLLSISGTVVSITVMTVAVRYIRGISLVGISILGAESHIITQLLLTSSLFLGKASFNYLLPPFVLLSLITGSITGMIAYLLYSKIEGRIEVSETS